jgi:hypothetical protein
VGSALHLLVSKQALKRGRYGDLQRRQMFAKDLPDQDGIEIVVSVPQVVAYAPDVPPRLAGTQNFGVLAKPLWRPR